MGREHGVLAPVSVVPNGVDLERFTLTDADERREARRALGLHERAPTAVCIGRLSAQKGQHVLLDAWPTVLRELPDARLVLVGSGPDEDELRERAASLEGVQMVGPRSDVPTWLSAADVVVFPSQYEGAALAPMEAMAAGRSVIASWIEGIEESLPYECGAMVRPDRPDEFAEAILAPPEEPEAGRRRGDARLAPRAEHPRRRRVGAAGQPARAESGGVPASTTRSMSSSCLRGSRRATVRTVRITIFTSPHSDQLVM